jgi:hypothetical protein
MSSANAPIIQVSGSELRTRFPDAEGRSSEEVIQSQEIVRVTLERAAGCIHWYLQHRAGWTFHFNEEFVGSDVVVAWLEQALGFSTPTQIAGPGGHGIVAWSRV